MVKKDNLIIENDISYDLIFNHKVTISEKQNRQEKLAIIGEFSARIAHDIRNPLSILVMSLENLKILYGTDEAKQKQLDRAERAITRITHQIEDVLDFVRERPINLEKIILSELLDESLDLIKIPDDIKIIIPKNNTKLFCDKRQILIVLNNLILNAIQAIDNTGTIEIILKENNTEIIIKVKDSGNGMSEDVMEKIFEPLFTTKQQGTGLGLSSVKSIISAHGGMISVTTHPTIFTIILPKIK